MHQSDIVRSPNKAYVYKQGTQSDWQQKNRVGGDTHTHNGKRVDCVY